jgi:hypothetical protein
MNMTSSMNQWTAMDLIVGLSVLFALTFLVAWIVSPALRAWVERPKYRLQENMRRYDQGESGQAAREGRNSPK